MVVLPATLERRAREAALEFSNYYPVRAAYLFGSHITGMADEFSDIDLAIFADSVETWDAVKRAQTISRVQLKAGFDIEFHVFSSSSLDAPDLPSFAAYVRRHGAAVDIGR
ncbi:MAG: nucleotidyltransferase domain-containing protein [Nitrospinae bacterium]|nr:nucleotidyltransferase domain-containing protein [Nitrospinota bacterium]